MKRLLSVLAMLVFAAQVHAGSALSTVTVSQTLTMTSPSAVISMTGVSSTAHLRNVSSTAMETTNISATTVNGQSIVSGSLVKAWVKFNGNGGCTVTAGYNVASCTRNNTGDYTVTFASALPSANYSWQCNSLAVGGAGNFGFTSTLSTISPTTGAFRFGSLILSGGVFSASDSGDLECTVVGG